MILKHKYKFFQWQPFHMANVVTRWHGNLLPNHAVK
jgi:hypothetical protein